MDSKIVQFYTNKTIFITGSTGFLGQLFVEKLLRTCPDLCKLYLLVRPKKGKSAEERVNDIFKEKNFEKLKVEQPNFMEKVYLVDGNLEEDGLGLSNEDRQMLENETNCVIHCGATVRFDEKLRKAVKINIKSVKDLIEIAKNMKNLKAFLYISTAYSNCTRTEISEQIYEPLISAPKLFQLLDALDDETLDKITPILIGDYPNNYSFSKSIAENLIKSEASNLPIGICRPSIVTSSSQDPVPGWINNIYGPVGIMVATNMGLLHSLLINMDNVSDMIPVDYVINCSLVALWEIAEEYKFGEIKEPLVYNCVSSPESPLVLGDFQAFTFYYSLKFPLSMCGWHKFIIYCKTRMGYKITGFFLHTIPAYLADFVAKCCGKQQRFVNDFKKIEKFLSALSYFGLREWKFDNSNVQNLWERLNDSDRRLFYFSMKNFDWDQFVKNYVLGIRLYLLKDPLETLPKSLAWQKKLKVLHYIFVTVLGYSLYKFVLFIVRFLVI